MEDEMQSQMSPKKQGTSTWLVAGLFLLGVAVWSVTSKGSGDQIMSEQASQDIMENPVPAVSEVAMMTEENTFTLEAGSFYYKPSVITVKKGETVKIVLNSVDMMHDFVIDELDVRTEIIKSGESGEVTFTPTVAGEFEFYCSVEDHRDKGAVGTLIVTE